MSGLTPISALGLPHDVVRIILLETMDLPLCAMVCKSWNSIITTHPSLYRNILSHFINEKKIVPILTSTPEFDSILINFDSANLDEATATGLVQLVYRRIMEETSEFKSFPKGTSFSVIYPIFENLEDLTLINYLHCWNELSKYNFVRKNHPKNIEGTLHQKAETIRKWMLQFRSKAGYDVYFTGSPLRRLPEDFFKQLKKASRIGLGHTCIKSLPAGISQCKDLIELDLRGNQIRSLPSELALCPRLERVYIDHDVALNMDIPEEITNLMQWDCNLSADSYSSSSDDEFIYFESKKIKAKKKSRCSIC
jgi:hypothetical protein